jgi:hypothetical protein
MPISPIDDVASVPSVADVPESLIDFLKDHENPFNDFVHAPVSSRSANGVHVPEINQNIHQTLLAAIERYR